ncbi:DNA polymerase III subunit epsilon [Actinomycetota bacterium]|nr:DNA polymerase III subunit epsilon [Actinomycetota bacterium]
MNRLIGFDTETTGIDIKRARIVEIALVTRTINQNEVEDDINSWIVNPDVKIPDEVIKIHGISNEIAQSQGRDAKESVDKLANILCDAQKNGDKIVIYNAGYDLGILHYELKRYELPSMEERLGGPLVNVIDPFALDRVLDKDRKGSRKLVNLLDVYKVEYTSQLHHAAVDAQMTLDILEQIFIRYPEIAMMSNQELFDFQKDGVFKFVTNRNEWARRHGYSEYSPTWISRV